MRSMKKILTGLLLCLLAASASAQLAGKNVILIHGFQSSHILNPPLDDGLSSALAYWSDFEPAIMDPASSRILHWSSHNRLSGSGGVAASITAQLKPILSSGFCDNACVIMTHSTGDLVTRYVLANKLSLFGSRLANRFKVAAVIDMAGAGGGTDLGTLGVDAVKGLNVGTSLLNALTSIFGFNPATATDPGILVDLQPSVARNTALNRIPAIPRLRIAAAGADFLGLVAHPLIKGGDDGVVPLHSACGAAYDGAFDSCVKDLDMNGQITRVSKAPSLSQLYDYHYPIILSATLAHNDMQIGKTGNDMVFASGGADLYHNSGLDNLQLSVKQDTVRKWWDWFHKYRVISGSSDKDLGQLIYETFQ